MDKHGIDDAAYSKAREVVYEQVKWTEAERAFRGRPQPSDRLTLSSCLRGDVLRSSLGAILGVPCEDRAAMLEMSDADACTSSRGRNSFADNFGCLLERATNLGGSLTESVAYGMITNLRLVDRGITDVDAAFGHLTNLRFLSLSGNAIRRISGGCLPRSLTFLELYRNELEDVRSLSETLPAGLLHLGLARNNLRDGSGLELLGKNRRLSLRTLDLEGNNIVNLLRLLKGLSNLQKLSALKLEGNPCALCYLYCQAVAAHCPSLIYLDDVAFSGKSHAAGSDLVAGTKSGTLCFFCTEVSGVEEPKTQAPVRTGYHAEVELPLFDPVKRLDIINGIAAGEKVERGGVLAFRSPRVSWSEVIRFPRPCARIRVPEFAGLTELRDTFRSTVTVRVRQTKFAETDVEEPCNSESVLDETTVAEFDVDLDAPPWCVPSLDYEWIAGLGRSATPATTQSKRTRSADGADAGAKTVRCRVGFGVQRTAPDSVRDAIA